MNPTVECHLVSTKQGSKRHIKEFVYNAFAIWPGNCTHSPELLGKITVRFNKGKYIGASFTRELPEDAALNNDERMFSKLSMAAMKNATNSAERMVGAK